MLMFGNPIYMVGGCISATVHKNFIKKLNLKEELDVNVMVDEENYKYKDDLLNYFDNVYMINLAKAKMVEPDNIDPNEKRYLLWIEYTVNKWQVLNYYQYNKILFIDIDFIPINDKFYGIFTYNTPAVLLDKKGKTEGGLVDYMFFDKNKLLKDNDKLEWDTAIDKLTGSINASLILLKPAKGLYDEYLSFLRLCEGSKGIDNMHVDERTLVLFLQFYKNMNLYNIPYWFSAYFLYEHYKKNYYAINYPIKIKPWIKPKFLQRKEETIWPIIATIALSKNKKIYNMYKSFILEHMLYFFNNYNMFLEQYKNKNTKWFEKNFFTYDRTVMDNPKFRNYLGTISSYVKYCLDSNNKKELKYINHLTDLMAKNVGHKIEYNVDDLMSAFNL